MRRTRRWRTLLVALAGAVAALAVVAGAAAAPPQEQQKPSIEGEASQGKTLTANNGQWSNNPTLFSYQWQRCNQEGNNCTSIGGAREKTYKVNNDDVGKRLRVLVTATNADGSTTANSDPTGVVSSKDSPRMQTRPSISGKAEVGEELNANPGEWTGFPRFSYQWQQCDDKGANCKDIAGATSKVYGVRNVDKDHTIRVEVTARTGGGSEKGTSDRTAVIGGTAAPAPPVGVGGALSVTAVSLPNRLVVSQIQFTPRVIRSRNEPLVARVRISEMQGGRPVAGALVYSIGVPENRISAEGERQTDASGWATFTYRVLPGLPMKAGARMTFFVRARKPGDSILAGVSSRRLVSVGVSPTR